MKRLISAKDVEDAAAKGENLLVDDNTIVTAQARDLAREHGVLLQCAHEAAAAPAPAKVCEPQPPCRGGSCEPAPAPAACCDHREPALSAEEMEKVIRAAVDRGIWTEQELACMLSGLKSEACHG
ncbi:hypothetical protein [Collinsella sp. D33t1_170424_A12]|uniref:hypothetical protein n=1 Tax=Collinsella sp. D33t1_170424_A12 TaxID=2787135 RepID=UPI00189C3E93|nr:hypothetical protein [Collinsella sp. D33t1_170424_A12]